jgi:hypothetical protein
MALLRHAIDAKKKKRPKVRRPVTPRGQGTDEGKKEGQAAPEVRGAKPGGDLSGSAVGSGGRKDAEQAAAPTSGVSRAMGEAVPAGEPGTDNVSRSTDGIGGRKENPGARALPPVASHANGKPEPEEAVTKDPSRSDASRESAPVSTPPITSPGGGDAGERANQGSGGEARSDSGWVEAPAAIGSVKKIVTSDPVRPHPEKPVRRSAFVIRKDTERI